jgi:hypothetical protein
MVGRGGWSFQVAIQMSGETEESHERSQYVLFLVVVQTPYLLNVWVGRDVTVVYFKIYPSCFVEGLVKVRRFSYLFLSLSLPHFFNRIVSLEKTMCLKITVCYDSCLDGFYW